MRKRKAYFGRRRGKPRHFPEILIRTGVRDWLTRAVEVMPLLFNAQTARQDTFSTHLYPTITVPFDGE